MQNLKNMLLYPNAKNKNIKSHFNIKSYNNLCAAELLIRPQIQYRERYNPNLSLYGLKMSLLKLLAKKLPVKLLRTKGNYIQLVNLRNHILKISPAVDETHLTNLLFETYCYLYIVPEMLKETPFLLSGEEINKSVFGRTMVKMKKINATPITEFTLEEKFEALFQITWTCYIFEKHRFKHNDLHIENVLFERLPQPVKYTFDFENKQFVLNTKIKAYVFDFDRSYSFSDEHPKNDLSKFKYENDDERYHYDLGRIICFFIINGGMKKHTKLLPIVEPMKDVIINYIQNKNHFFESFIFPPLDKELSRKFYPSTILKGDIFEQFEQFNQSKKKKRTSDSNNNITLAELKKQMKKRRV